LWAIQKEIFILEGQYKAAGIRTGPYTPMATTEGIATIPMAQAQDLLARFRQAYEIYPSVVDRYATVRPLLATLSQIPFIGPYYMGLVGAYDKSMKKLDEQVFFARDAVTAMGDIVVEGGSAIQIQRGTFDKIRNWTAEVFMADETLKRLEGAAANKPAEATPAPQKKLPWVVIGLAGAALAGLVYLAAKD
jgi:hypothetical protein